MDRPKLSTIPPHCGMIDTYSNHKYAQGSEGAILYCNYCVAADGADNTPSGVRIRVDLGSLERSGVWVQEACEGFMVRYGPRNLPGVLPLKHVARG